MATSRDGAEPPPAGPPHRVRLPVNIHRWERIAFLHWPYEPAAVARLLPDGLAPLTWNGAAWVGVTPFVIRVRPPAVPVFPPGWTFPETNLRTYVTGPDGRQVLWFLRMEVTARWFVAVMRSLGLPYFRQRMTVDAGSDRIVYRSRPGQSGEGGHRIVIRPGDEIWPPGGGEFERFLTARWGAYHRPGRVLLHTRVEHPPWLLRRAAVERCEVDGMFAAVGLSAPGEPAVAHFSRGVATKVGVPRIV